MKLGSKVDVSRVATSDLFDVSVRLPDGADFPIADLGYPVCTAVDWVVSKFRYFKNEQLELWATVDFAALDLIQLEKAVTMNKKAIMG